MSDPLLRDMDSKRAQLLDDGYVILRQVVPPEHLDSLRQDIESVVQRQRSRDPEWDTTPQPRALIAEQVEAETVGAFEFLLHAHTHGVSAGLLNRPREAVAATSAMVLCNPEFTPGDPERPGQSWGTDPRNWHRDVRPDRDGPLGALLEDQRANGPAYVQWNVALYEDHHLYVVPGSHGRLTAEVEASHLQQDRGTLTPLPKSIWAELNPGDGVVYNNTILHWGRKYTHVKKRRTIHMGYRSFGSIFPNQKCYLPVDFWKRFAEGTPQRSMAAGWLALYQDEFANIEDTFRAAAAGDYERFFAGLARLHRPEKGRLACLILLSKVARDLNQTSRESEGTNNPRQAVYEWLLEDLTSRLSGDECERLWQRFEPLDRALKTGSPGHVSGFLGPTTDYEFEQVPPGMTTDTVLTGLLGLQPAASDSLQASG